METYSLADTMSICENIYTQLIQNSVLSPVGDKNTGSTIAGQSKSRDSSPDKNAVSGEEHYQSMGSNKPSRLSVSDETSYKQDIDSRKPEAFSTKNLKVLAINTCGLRSKLNYPEFVELIHSYDINGVQETKLDNIDSIRVPGYEIICQNRNELSRCRSGGTALIVKSSIFPFIKTHESKSKLIQWFSISNRLTQFNTNIWCGIVYIPPYGSKYSHEDPYLKIHTEYSSYSSDNETVILFGDFNSRIACLDDFVIVDFETTK